MKKLFICFGIVISATLVQAADDPTVEIRAQFIKAAQAVIKGDADAILDSTYPGLIQRVGGRVEMRAKVIDSLMDLRHRKLSVQRTEVVSISQPVEAGEELHSVVRAKRIMQGPGGRQIQDTFMIAVSSDRGKNWTFVDGQQLTPQHIMALFPNFNTSLVLPRTAPPVMEEGGS
jgi:hypothetical protein